MDVDEDLQRLFLEQMKALEQFRIAYTGRHPEVPLDRGDQDVQRLVEALAFFSARTRRAASRTAARSTWRLFAQHFPHLMAPVPGLALFEARIDGQFVDPASIPLGEEIAVEPPGLELPEADSPPPLAFRALRPLEVRPLALVDVLLDRRGRGRGAELLLGFDAGHARRWPIGELELQVDHLGELAASAAVHHALASSVERVEVQWDERGARAPVKFRSSFPPQVRGAGAVDHPLLRARHFFRLPEQDLRLGFSLPEPPGAEWTVFRLHLHLSEGFPRGLELGRDTFRLHVVPAANLRREMAAPIELDGTREVASIEHPDTLGGYRLHSVQGVYALHADEGLLPLQPGFVPEAPGRAVLDPVWETETEGRGDARRGRLRVVAPQAVEHPLRVVVEGWWHQPGRARDLPEGAPARFSDRFLEGLELELLGRARSPVPSALEGDDEAQLALLAARSRRSLRLPELRLLLDVLRGPLEPSFGPLVAEMSGCEVRAVPSAVAVGGFRYDYELTFDGLDVAAVPLLVLMARRLAQVLTAWSTEEVVGLRLRLPRLDAELEIRGPEEFG